MTTTTDHDPAIPEDILEALRHAAAAVPATDLHPTGPVLRLQSRRRRRRFAIATGASAAAVLALVAVNLAPGDDQVVIGPDDTSGPPTSQGAGAGIGVDQSAPVLMPQTGAELLPDGTIRRLPTARPKDILQAALRLHNGHLVTLASRDLAPGTSRRDGPFVQALSMVLAVFDGNGKLLGEHDIRRVGQEVRLAGEHDGKIVLVRSHATQDGRPLRGVDISAIDPTTFVETPITSVETMPGIPDVAAGRLVVAGDAATAGGGRERCTLQVVDLATTATDAVDLPRCVSLTDASLSPDGRRAAVVLYVDDGGLLRPVLYVVDVDTGDVRAERRLDDPGACRARDRRMCPSPEYRALVWRDADTVDAVVQDPDPTPGNRMVVGLLVPERLRTVTVTVD